jgi:hypothetical protein
LIFRIVGVAPDMMAFMVGMAFQHGGGPSDRFPPMLQKSFISTMFISVELAHCPIALTVNLNI